MKPSIIAALSLSLASCATNWKGSDGYFFEGKQYDKSLVIIRKVEYPSLAALRAAAKNVGNEDPRNILAFTTPVPDSNICIIHVVAPDVMYMPDIVGHEVLHCFYGEWHPKFTARGPIHRRNEHAFEPWRELLRRHPPVPVQRTLPR